VLLSALAPQQVVEADAQVGSSYHRMSRIAALHTPAFSDLVTGLCHQLWDQLSQYGSGNAFSLLAEQDLEGLSGNRAVQQAIERLAPLSKAREANLSLLIDAYCTDGCTAAERRELGLSRALTRQDQLDLLIVLLRESWTDRRMLAMHGHSDPRTLPRLIVYLFGIERVTRCAALEVMQLTAALTYVIDALGDGFTLWVNIDSGADLTHGVKQSLGPRFLARVTHDLTT
jgi:hypothetical protein